MSCLPALPSLHVKKFSEKLPMIANILLARHFFTKNSSPAIFVGFVAFHYCLNSKPWSRSPLIAVCTYTDVSIVCRAAELAEDKDPPRFSTVLNNSGGQLHFWKFIHWVFAVFLFLCSLVYPQKKHEILHHVKISCYMVILQCVVESVLINVGRFLKCL